MKKLVAVILSVMLLIGCVGSAETRYLGVNVTYLDQNLFSAMLNEGTDEDGCETVSVSANLLGQAISAFIQASGAQITVGSGEMAYTVTADALSAALTSVIAQLVPAQIIAYVTGGAFSQDMQVISYVAMSEANRLMGIAAQAGFVTMSAEGDMVIAVDADMLIDLAAEYLTQVSADERVLSYLTSTTIWGLAGLPEATVLSQFAAMLGEQLAAMDADMLGIAAEVQITVNASGSLQLEAEGWLGGNGFTVDAAYDESGISAELSAMVNGEEYSFDFSFDGTDLYEGYSIPGIVWSESLSFSDGVYSAMVSESIVLDGMEIAINEDLSLDLNDLSFEMYAVLSNEVNAEVNQITVSYTGELTEMTENGFVYEIEISISDIQDVKLIIAFEGTEAVITVLDGEGESFGVITAGVRMKNENTMKLYAIVNGIEYALTITASDSGIQFSLDSDYNGNTVNIGTAIISAGVSDETFSHISGYAISTEELTQLFGMLIMQLM